MKLTPEQIERAKKRRLKEPLEITGYEVKVLKVHAAGQPKTRQEFVTWTVRTIGDLASLDAQAKLGKFIPMPDLALQALMIVIDKLDLLEEEAEAPGPTGVVTS